MLKYLCLAVLFFLNLGCTLPGPFNDFKAYYTQRLTPLAWSEDSKSLVLMHSTYNKDYQFNLTYLKLDIISKDYKFLYESDKDDFFYLIAVDSVKESLFLYNKGNVYQRKDKLDTSLNLKIDSPKAEFVQDHLLIYKESQTHRDEPGLPFKSLFAYSISDQQLNLLNQQPLLVENIQETKPYKGNVYFASQPIARIPVKGVKVKHALGKLDLEKMLISQAQNLPEYEGHLRFRDWLSQDELLFSQIDDKGTYLNTVSYRLSTQSYEVREDFRQKGLLSPNKDKVAFVEGDFLIISQPDGSHAEKILFIPRDLPKGDPEYLE